MFCELVRVDALLVSLNLAGSKSAAQRLIKAGSVEIVADGERRTAEVKEVLPLNEAFQVRCGRKWAKTVIESPLPNVTFIDIPTNGLTYAEIDEFERQLSTSRATELG